MRRRFAASNAISWKSLAIKAMRIIARKLGVSPEYIETGARVPRAAERELRLAPCRRWGDTPKT